MAAEDLERQGRRPRVDPVERQRRAGSLDVAGCRGRRSTSRARRRGPGHGCAGGEYEQRSREVWLPSRTSFPPWPLPAVERIVCGVEASTLRQSRVLRVSLVVVGDLIDRSGGKLGRGADLVVRLGEDECPSVTGLLARVARPPFATRPQIEVPSGDGRNVPGVRLADGQESRRRSGIKLEDRAAHSLKGVPGEWKLFAVR